MWTEIFRRKTLNTVSQYSIKSMLLIVIEGPTIYSVRPLPPLGKFDPPCYLWPQKLKIWHGPLNTVEHRWNTLDLKKKSMCWLLLVKAKKLETWEIFTCYNWFDLYQKVSRIN